MPKPERAASRCSWQLAVYEPASGNDHLTMLAWEEREDQYCATGPSLIRCRR